MDSIFFCIEISSLIFHCIPKPSLWQDYECKAVVDDCFSTKLPCLPRVAQHTTRDTRDSGSGETAAQALSSSEVRLVSLALTVEQSLGLGWKLGRVCWDTQQEVISCQQQGHEEPLDSWGHHTSHQQPSSLHLAAPSLPATNHHIRQQQVASLCIFSLFLSSVYCPLTWTYLVKNTIKRTIELSFMTWVLFFQIPGKNTALEIEISSTDFMYLIMSIRYN